MLELCHCSSTHGSRFSIGLDTDPSNCFSITHQLIQQNHIVYVSDKLIYLGYYTNSFILLRASEINVILKD